MSASTSVHLASGVEARIARRSMVLVALFVAFWAVVEVIAMSIFARVTAYQVVWARYGVHLVLMLLLWGRHDPGRLWRTGRPVYHIGRWLLMLIMPLSWIAAHQHGVAAGTLMTIFWTSPLLVLVLAIVLRREPVSLRCWMVAWTAFAGACIVLRPSELSSLKDLLFPLGMAASFGLYVVMTRTLRAETWHANLFYTALGVFLALTPLMPFIWVMPSVSEAIAIVVIGSLGFCGLLALDRAVCEAPLAISAPILYLHVPLVLAISASLGHVAWDMYATLGAGLIAASAVFLWLREEGAPATRIGAAAICQATGPWNPEALMNANRADTKRPAAQAGARGVQGGDS